jgi:hypothetical protein
MERRGPGEQLDNQTAAMREAMRETMRETVRIQLSNGMESLN